LETHPRRADYRRAREELLAACGQQTLALDQAHADEFEALRTGQTEGAASSGRFCLIDQDGLHNLKVGLNTIGRLPDNDIPVADGSVSRRHCAIVVHASHVCEVYDTASKNGTFVNGERINGLKALKSGDKIRVCDRQFVFAPGPSDATNDGHTHVED
jgi:pSer/pThr/pTyr-binding forkhead associated (FHA) protein